jgi:hypothetical protein
MIRRYGVSCETRVQQVHHGFVITTLVVLWVLSACTCTGLVALVFRGAADGETRYGR